MPAVRAPGRVVVCGAGVVGAAVAYFLARRGVAVTLVEREGVACAASGKSGGFLALDWCDGSPVGPLARASFALHAELARELDGDHGYRRMDTFMLAAREQGRAPGGHRIAPPAWLDGAGAVTAALGSPETTAQVHPARFTRALVDAATARGADLVMGVVEAVMEQAGAATGVRVDGQVLAADAVVLALGPWTDTLGARLGLPRVAGLKGFSVTLAAPDVPAHALFVEYRTADGRHLEPEIFPRPDGHVYVCGMADPQPLPEAPSGVLVSADACAILARAAGRVSSALAYFIVTTNAFMHHPVGYVQDAAGVLRLTDLGAFLLNPWALVAYAHVMAASVTTAAFVVAAVGAFWLLSGVHRPVAAICLRTGVIAGLAASVLVAFPTGDLQGKMTARYKPAALATMEGRFETVRGAEISRR